MTAKKQPAAEPERPQREFTITLKTIFWFAGGVGTVLLAVIAWYQIWDRIDAHWRLETVQAATDKRIDADIKSTRDKAEQDTKTLARRAEVGRAWVLFSVLETKAYTAAQFARICKALKLPADECERQKSDADNFRDEAIAAKKTASEAGKEK